MTASGSVAAELVPSIQRGYPAVRLDDLDRVLRLQVQVDGIRASGTVADLRLELVAESPFVRYGGRVFQLANPPYRSAGQYWVPTELLTGWMGTAAGLAWQEREGVIVRAPGGTVADGSAAGAGAQAATDDARPLSAPGDGRRPGPWRVVIDPGHGGRDPGSIGHKGIREKDITFAIAKELYRVLSEDPAYEPILTRDRDTLIDLRDRPRVAITRDADMFISIHANWFSNRQARGFETYFLGEARTEESKRVAIRENSAIEYEDPATRPKPDALDYILTSLRQNMNLTESRHFAGLTQNALRSTADSRDRGVKQAGYWVLVGASGTMPAVLVEVGFITSPGEAEFLRGKDGQRQIASGLADAVRGYFDNYGERLMAAGGGG